MRRNAYFGVPLQNLIDRENSGMEVPLILRRILDEIERRGVDSNGIYLCQFQMNILMIEVSQKWSS